MFAELVINIEAALAGTFHYHVPDDLLSSLKVGHLVEVEFGRRLAQGIVVRLDRVAPVDETKPIISLIDQTPVVYPWQIELARWLSNTYLAALNSCLRLMLPPGLSRWADITLELDPEWDGSGRLTDTQRELIELLRNRGDLRGRQIDRILPKSRDWRTASNQLASRGILRKASVLDPPRVRPKKIRTAELIASPARIRDAALKLGRKNKGADVLYFLLTSPDPLPTEARVLQSTGATRRHFASLASEELVRLAPAEQIVVPAASLEVVPAELRSAMPSLPKSLSGVEDPLAVLELAERGLVRLVEQPATVSLMLTARDAVFHIYRLRGGQIYHAILRHLSQAATIVPVSDLQKATKGKMYHLRRLAQLELIRLGDVEVWRDPLADRDFVPTNAPRLTADQSLVWEDIKDTMASFAVKTKPAPVRQPLEEFAQEGPWSISEDVKDDTASPYRPRGADAPILLHGVTGSGKTEIYMRAIDLALRRGQTAIVLVPEIALTPQTLRRFAARFPGQVAVHHSRLSDGERYDTWRRARQGMFDIVVGPRSALFTPLQNLGVIVVDEEHDHSYKQTPPVPPPYYHARETAIELGELVGASVILGSATPDLVSYHRAQSGRYRLLELPRRIMGHKQRIASQVARLRTDSSYSQADDDPDDALTIGLPPIQVVDLRQELRAGNRSIFGRMLQQAVTDTLERGEQVILFLNRRGTATFVICRDCGLVLNCPRCDTPLTFHRPGALLACHYCGRKEPPHKLCPRCGSHRIKYFGLGTEEVERRVRQRWPKARIVRWDRDTTAGKDTHENLLSTFVNHEADVLVGTQMIAKGLDLPLVTLVGVISADVSLGLPDYRTGERTFQVLAQVAGRAGRGLLGGRVIIQSYQPEHYAIRAAAEHDYATFYLEEIRFRTQHGLPPFRRLAKLIFADPQNTRAERESKTLASALRRHVREKALGATEIVGPVPPFFNRIDGRYRWQIIVRTPDPVRLLQDFTVPSGWILDVDPVSTL